VDEKRSGQHKRTRVRNAIYDELVARDFNLKEIAARLGMQPNSVSRMRHRGARKPPKSRLT